MATGCKEHGTESRLRCVTCEAPICQKCLVATKVGFKCPAHGLMATAQRGETAKPRSGGRPPRAGGGMGLFPVFLVLFVGFPILTVALGALFAVTADETGFVAFLPLLAVFVLLTWGAVAVGRRLTRS